MHGDPIADRRTTFSDTSRITHAVEYLLEDRGREKKPICDQHQPRHQRRRPRRIERRVALARCLSRRARDGRSASPPATRAGKGAERRATSAGSWAGSTRAAASRRAVSRSSSNGRWSATASRTSPRTSSRSGTARRTGSPCAVQAAGRSASGSTVKPRQYVENRRLRERHHASRSTTSSIIRPTARTTSPSICRPICDPRQLPRDRGRRLEGAPDRRRDPRRADSTPGSSATIPARSVASGGRRLFRFPSFFTETSNIDSHSISSLACGHRVIAVANLDEPGSGSTPPAARARRGTADASRRSPRRAPTSSPPTASRIRTSHGLR